MVTRTLHQTAKAKKQKKKILEDNRECTQKTNKHCKKQAANRSDCPKKYEKQPIN